MKKVTVILAIVTILLGMNNIQLNGIVEAKNENIKIIENENNRLTQQLENVDVELAKYKNIVNSFNDIEVKNINYTYYDLPFSIYEQEYIQDLAYQNNISYELIISLIKLESDFNQYATSSSNCLGYMQLNNRYLENTYSVLAGIENPDPYDFKQNIKMGISYIVYLREYLRSLGYDSEEVLIYMVLGSYNKGINNYLEYYYTSGDIHTSYANIILKYKMQLETTGEIY